MELNKFDEAIKVLEEGKKMLQNKKWIDPVYKKCMFLKKKKEDEERKIEEIVFVIFLVKFNRKWEKKWKFRISNNAVSKWITRYF